MRCKKLLIKTFANLLLLLLGGEICSGFEIIRPKAGAVFHPGDKVIVELGTEPNESLSGVWFYTVGIGESDFDFVPTYNFEFTVPNEFIGAETIVANGKLQNNSRLESRVQINITLPDTVALEKLIVEPPKIYLWKVPAGTQGAHFYEEKQLDVQGLFSDGIARDLSPSSTGTTYSSSDEKVATVDSEGLVAAISFGTAQIIIKNGNKQEAVYVNIKNKNMR